MQNAIQALCLLILAACGDTNRVSTNDFTRGEAMEVENNNANATPISGNQNSHSRAMDNGCQTSSDCDESQACDMDIFQCVPIPTDGDGIADTAFEPDEEPDAGSGEDIGNGCSSTQDIQFFQGEHVCKQGCDDAYSTETERCQQTPSRIADCLAEASVANQECQAGCPNVIRLMSNCLGQCSTNSDRKLCSVMCVRQGVSLSASCFTCIENRINCSANRCQTSCFINDNSVCEACIYSSCEQEFQDCAGIALP